jgi:hypothetical protein
VEELLTAASTEAEDKEGLSERGESVAARVFLFAGVIGDREGETWTEEELRGGKDKNSASAGSLEAS